VPYANIDLRIPFRPFFFFQVEGEWKNSDSCSQSTGPNSGPIVGHTVLYEYSTVEMVLSNQPEVGCCGSGGLCGALAPLDKVSEDRREG
jgi:hypothetical protein